MIFITSAILVLGVIINTINILLMRVHMKCALRYDEGLAFCRIITDHQFYGWVSNRDILSLTSNVRSKEEHIRVHTKNDVILVQMISIKELRKVMKPSLVLIKNF